MPVSCTHLYVHFVWATWDRRPLLVGELRSRVFAVVTEECRKLRCLPVAVGGVEDHVHLLVRLHPEVSVSALAHQMKGVSSHLIRRSRPDFRWQGSYGAFTLDGSAVPRLREYVENQEAHHASGRLWPFVEACERISDAPVRGEKGKTSAIAEASVDYQAREDWDGVEEGPV